MNIKVYVDDDYRENFLKSSKLKYKKNLPKSAQEIVNEVVKEHRGIIIK